VKLSERVVTCHRISFVWNCNSAWRFQPRGEVLHCWEFQTQALSPTLTLVAYSFVPTIKLRSDSTSLLTLPLPLLRHNPNILQTKIPSPGGPLLIHVKIEESMMVSSNASKPDKSLLTNCEVSRLISPGWLRNSTF
jgi:hypothetical protein